MSATDSEHISRAIVKRAKLSEYLLRRLIVLRKLPGTIERDGEIRDLTDWIEWLKGAI